MVGEILPATERDGQIEPEPVDLHLLRPVAQRVQHQPLRDRVAEVDRVADAGDVDVHAVGVLAVVGGVVESAEACARPADAFLGGVVVDHVQHHLDARLVQQLHHPLELAQHPLGTLGLRLPRRVRRVRAEEVQGVVAPVVGQALADESLLGGEGVHGQELDGGDAEILEVRDGGLVRQTGVGAAELLRHFRVLVADAAHVRFVDHRVVERCARLARVAPVETVRHHGRAPLLGSDPGEPARVRIQQQALRVEHVLRRRGTGRADGVQTADLEAARAAQPDVVGIPVHLDGLGAPVGILRVEQAELHRVGVLGVDAQLTAVRTDADAQVAQRIDGSHAF